MCNTGVGLTPIARGSVHHFESRGLYNGVSLLWDMETGSLWNHITGESVHGALKGEVLTTFNVLHTTVEAALSADPELEVAISGRGIRRHNLLAGLAGRMTSLPPGFRKTMAGEDLRRPVMEIGLGVWIGEHQRYYPMSRIRDSGGVIADSLTGRGLVVFIDPGTQAAEAFFSDGRGAAWREGVLRFASGATYDSGVLRAADGERQAVERPMQLFTRWYGFALTFPGTRIYGD